AEVAGGGVEPVLDVRHHLGRGAPGVGAYAANGGIGADGADEVAPGVGPGGAVIEPVHPGGVAGGGGDPLAGVAVGVGGPFTPVGQQPHQLDGCRLGGGLGNVQAEGHAVDGRPGRDVAGDVKGDQAAADQAVVGLARDEVTAGAVA